MGLCSTCDAWQDSTKVPWDVTHQEGREIYRLMALHFDISTAKRTLQAAPHPIVHVEADQLKAFLRPPKGSGHFNMFSGLSSTEQIPDGTDIPLIFATVRLDEGDTASWLIDGYHRLNRQYEQGCRRFCAVVLTLAESKHVAAQAGTDRKLWRKMFRTTSKLATPSKEAK